MKTLINLVAITLLCAVNHSAFADTDLSFIKPGLPYVDAKTILTVQAWKPVKNNRINDASLYAQEIYAQGMKEVVDCISMELDACKFRFSKGNQILEVKTITRQLSVDSFRTYKKR
ncbi:MAG: hypothetical protein B7Y16_07595 [Methylotenera sp. 24-45-7]|jgi:hypothetical protein|nr:MAG: hypothetical protein B7Y16_07595 [Methylotenera sp. 24-45-7]OZA09591.1 MAG: hypothetical protein B7X97_01960 [Methylotenera sp. 17-45-7]OZA50417.1 MAG: hypothetical protein B7X73_06790 [Methylophilales bacterium 39-45-7]HQS37396.1 hypothetical protein [Methylotenera sp.]HQS44130.1 hypothetical protein [Methylotenera sp.]